MPEMRMLAGRYQLVESAGRGSMGTVWRARDQLLNREVAVKEVRLPAGLTQEQRSELSERTMREARTAAQVSHQAVITVFDVVAEDGRPWIIMEYIDARSLEEIVDQEGPLSPRMAAELGYDLLSALRAAHKHGVLHRDVKPSNVLITEKGRVVLTDFGIAKQETDATLTRTGMVIGSPGYTAPERARGDYTGPESDLWSLGATLYYAVEGRPAYERDSVMATISALLTEDVDPPRQAGGLVPVLEGLLTKDPKKRMQAERASGILRKLARPHEPEEEQQEETSGPDASSTPSRPMPSQPPAQAQPARPRPQQPARPGTHPGRPKAPATERTPPRPNPVRPPQKPKTPAPANAPDPERTVALPWLSKTQQSGPKQGTPKQGRPGGPRQAGPRRGGPGQPGPKQGGPRQPRPTQAPRPPAMSPPNDDPTVAIAGRGSGAPEASDGLMTGVFGIARPPAEGPAKPPAEPGGLSREQIIMIVGGGIVVIAIILALIVLQSR